MGNGAVQIGREVAKNNTHHTPQGIIMNLKMIWIAHARLMIFAIINAGKIIPATRPNGLNASYSAILY
ncbi:MAG: hypothetical protein A4E62_00112 [Syntrophorhabdus sp. PtaU1.Bin002]|nr:MAG: hypothetical protein A4E62_00112 [Syntrophorhabdus sp. PtaU1.Bin002]